ncbi:MAG: glycosyltransferase family 39 protein [Bryobacteraceae bacterium]|jgi:4-amino-4-deoxy-L-arabinose transferase-like glycosyltransferase
MEGGGPRDRAAGSRRNARVQIIVALAAAAIFLGCIISPPGLMDDSDAVEAQIARNMLTSGDWVTAHLDGVAYLEKSPLGNWMMAVSFAVFGPHDWAARIPLALAAVALCWVTARFGIWAFGRKAGLYAGLALATSVGLFLFTRILIPDVELTLAVTLALWSLMRATEADEPHPGRWAMAMWASMAAGALLKGLIAVVFPVAAGLLYLYFTGRLFQRAAWARLRPLWGTLLFLAIAAPWHALATLKNPPYLDFTMHSERGSYHGFFWFYFINEHVLRFLNLRYPRDYNTVPRLYFWLFHLLWLFPWSAYFPAAARLSYRQPDRASRVRLMALCWAGFILVFFTFSTTQEYYSMPAYPAMALLVGSAIASRDRWLKYGTRAIAVATTLAAAAAAGILWMVRNMAAPGDIASALGHHPSLYTLSLGHMTDLTLQAFAYLKLPLAMALLAFAMGAAGAWRWRAGRRAVPAVALTAMMVLFFHAARLALVAWDPYMGSRPLAEALLQAPPGQLIFDGQYYTFSSVVFYANRHALLLNGRVNNLVYGSYAPNAPKDVFIDDAEFQRRWGSGERYYLVAAHPAVPRLENLAGQGALHIVAASGGKYLFTNQ